MTRAFPKLPTVLTGLACFAAGYCLRDRQVLASHADKPQLTLGQALVQRKPASAEPETQRAKVAAAPFAKENVRAWTRKAAASLESGKLRAATMFAQVEASLRGMEEEGVDEMMRELQAMIAAADPKHHIPNGDGKLDTLLYLAAMRLA